MQEAGSRLCLIVLSVGGQRCWHRWPYVCLWWFDMFDLANLPNCSDRGRVTLPGHVYSGLSGVHIHCSLHDSMRTRCSLLIEQSHTNCILCCHHVTWCVAWFIYCVRPICRHKAYAIGNKCVIMLAIKEVVAAAGKEQLCFFTERSILL